MNPAIFTLLAWEKENNTHRQAPENHRQPYGFLLGSRFWGRKKVRPVAERAPAARASTCECA